MFKTKKLLKQDNDVLHKDNIAKSAKIERLEKTCKEYYNALKAAEVDALEAKEQLKRQEHNNAQLQAQISSDLPQLRQISEVKG